MANRSRNPEGRTTVYRDNTGTWVIGILALFVVFGLLLWGTTGDALKTAMQPPVQDTNTGVMTGSAPPEPARP